MQCFGIDHGLCSHPVKSAVVTDNELCDAIFYDVLLDGRL